MCNRCHPDLGSGPAVTFDLEATPCMACGDQPAQLGSLVCSSCFASSKPRGVEFSKPASKPAGFWSHLKSLIVKAFSPPTC
jgi:hypothetical protein